MIDPPAPSIRHPGTGVRTTSRTHLPPFPSPRSLLLAALVLILPVKGIPAEGPIVINEILYHPSTHNAAHEFIELLNTGPNPVPLGGWEFTEGIQFQFPETTLAPGQHLVIAASLAAFTARYPSVDNVIGGWQGDLDDAGESIELRDAAGGIVASLHYANEGDWAVRRRGPPDFGTRGWEWTSGHAGLGSSAERLNPALPGNQGQNWAPSLMPQGTPGQPNSVAGTNTPPLILQTTHTPMQPSSADPVRITSTIAGETATGLSATLHYRNHSTPAPPPFTAIPMTDDGLEGDQSPDDRRFTGMIPAHLHNTIIEFYITAVDSMGASRSWPAPALDENGLPVQSVNALYQVSDDSGTGSDSRPLLRLIMTETERAELESIDRESNARMNATLISRDGTGGQIRHHAGIRIRGTSSRHSPIPSYRLSVPSDRRWHGLREFELNAFNAHAQVIGSVLALQAGLPASDARAVQVRINGQNLIPPDPPGTANGHGFGIYALVETLNPDWVSSHFPSRPSANAYTARDSGGPLPDLTHLGPDPQLYQAAGYAKASNETAGDWNDLIELTDILDNSSDPGYAPALRQVADPLNWARYFALNTLLGNAESGLSTGVAGNYNLVANHLVPHDFDRILVPSSLPPGTDIFAATQLPFAARFLKHPQFAPLYFQELLRLIDTVCSTNQINSLLDQFLGDLADPGTLSSMKAYAAARAANVRNQIPLQLTATNSLPIPWDFPYTTTPQTVVFGTANAATTRSIHVNGQPAEYIAWTGAWTHPVTLQPGINRVRVEALDEAGSVVESTHIDIHHDNGTEVEIAGGTLATNATWNSGGNAYHVSGTLVVPPGVTLHIGPGTTVFFGFDASLIVNGTLVADGTAGNPIHFLRQPRAQWVWRGIHINDSTNDNIIRHAVLRHTVPDPPVTVLNSTATLDGLLFGVRHTCIYFVDSSLLIQNCRFPRLTLAETLIGYGIMPGGRLVIQGNYFGGTTGYSDLIEYTGGQRPGPIVQVISNLFEFATDDAIDIDGTDAHIEGNVFRHIHRDAPRESIASAIATDAGSHVVVTRNVFHDCDNGINLKRNAYAVVANNVFVNCTDAAITFGSTNRAVRPGAGAFIDGNIFWNNTSHFTHHNEPPYSSAALDVRNSILEGTPWPGSGNLTNNPMFVDPAGDFRLRRGSPAIGTGPNGLDMGAHVPAGVSLSGRPRSPTPSTQAIFTLGGPGYRNPLIHDGLDLYRYRVNHGPWSNPAPIDQPLTLTNLPGGSHTVEAIGRNSAGVWQSEAEATRSGSWTVDTNLQRIVINEILAHNHSALHPFGTAPGAIELHNPGATPFNLSGMRLSNDPSAPDKFIFPPQTFLPPDGYLLLLAGLPNGTPGVHLGFSLDKSGDQLLLLDTVARGGSLLDSITFGIQPEDWSLSRLDDDSWGLSFPTLGAPNQPAAVAGPGRVRISEWLAAGSSGDFLELHNPEPIPAEISGCLLTDHPVGWPGRHLIPDLSFIAPRGYAAFLADGRPELGGNHLNFNLPEQQGTIALSNPAGETIHHVIYGPQQLNVSMGFLTPALFEITSLPEPSPGQSNVNSPPHVRIVTPSDNDNLVGEITITASADDPDGHIDRVEFHAGATKIGEASRPPYTLAWLPDPGPHTLTARAIDDRGAATGSSSVNILVLLTTGLEIEPILADGQVVAVRLTFEAAANNAYAIEASPEPGVPAWTTLLTLAAQPINYTPTLELPIDFNARFLRIRVFP